MKQKDPRWYDHLTFGDTFHAEEVTECGICGCQSNFWGIAQWYMVKKLYLICPGMEANPQVHDLIVEKRQLVCENKLPASVLNELKLEIAELKKRLRVESGAAEKHVKPNTNSQ